MIGKRKHSKHRSKHTINFFSEKNDCHMWCESFLERKYALHCEFDESVERYCSQPEYFSVFGQRYTPDFLVQYKSGHAEYVEVKHSSYMDDDFFLKHKKRKISIYEMLQLDLILVSEKDFNAVESENYERLRQYRNIDTTALISEIGHLPKRLTLKKLEKLIEKKSGTTRAHAWALVAKQHYHFDVSQPFSADSILMRP
ncbi:MAG: hypothetical protein JXQ95_19160 [Alteromonas stellipolaris]|uniref:TnsA endonuclease N-terminal domain-containing protein n=1 Tax=Alteromonas stellipolaris TaxID=233316 RepID=UPI003B8AE119